jgi:glucose/arabinose dehydrogenase
VPVSARILALLAMLLVLAGCGAAGAQSDPTWVPAQTASAIPLPTQVPDGSGNGTGGGSTTPSPNTSSPSDPSSSSPIIDPNVVATNLTTPTGIATLPDGTALVGERSTGRILLVQPVAGMPVKVAKTLDGLDTNGGGGLLDIALSATYSEDGLVLALITTATDTRLVHFTLGGAVTPILTGIPRGASDNTGKLLVLDNGDILVGTGDAGQPTLAGDPASLAGKVLRVDDLGQPLSDNPTPGSPIYTSGHKTVNGLCVDPTTSIIYATEAGSSDELNKLTAGSSYGWPGGGGTSGLALPTTIGGVGGCAVIDNDLYVTGLGGDDVFQSPLDAKGAPSTFTALLAKKYGRISNVVASADGTLWMTTSNKDGHGSPVADDERVIHIRPSGGGGSSDA